ncbi:MAG: glycerol-3-phosphate 1-O-acyltransferase PlsY [Elusimicrobia bacterium]|nr:glycerol-3-phosphate 1-O-acyltransferase PlsY [Elusimicrobiota bacterium]
MDLATKAGLVALSYLAGGIPTGYLAARRCKGIDIRQYGSGNPGTANVYRVAGTAAGAVTLAVDFLKGCLPVVLARGRFPDDPLFAVLCGAAAIVGHDWTVFLGFRGGKGVATSAGVFAALTPAPLALAALIFFVAVRLSGHISAGSLAGAAALPVLCLLLRSPAQYGFAALAACALIVYKHIPNIRRLRASARSR